MWGMASEEPSGSTTVIQNSYHRINYLSNILSQLLTFILPAIIGVSLFRDYKSRIYTVLYSYPFTKADYLSAKFLSGFLVLMVVVSMVGLGFFLGSFMPGVNPDAIIPYNYGAYLHLYAFFIIPNMLLLSIVVFGVVAFTRNVYLGFIVSIIILLINGVAGSLLGGLENDMLRSLIDPLGGNSVKNVVKDWTLDDKNNSVLPVSGVILYNRIIWLAISIFIGIYCYLKFDFNQYAHKFKSKRKEEESATLQQFSQVEKIVIPAVNYEFSFVSKLKTIWKVSNLELRSIVISWPFVVIIIGGFLMVSFQQAGMAPQHGVPMLPTTSEMLRWPMFIFSGVFNLLTFLYTGILIYRGINSRMDALIDIVPQPNWTFMMSKLLAILKMQFILLTIVFISGVLSQTIQGYYDYEFSHYFLELYVIQFLHFAIWACLAMFIHTLFKNMYLSFFMMILIPFGIIMMPGAADTLRMPFLKESILHFNMVPGLFLGFDYSVFNGYGTALATYFTYKFYWLLGAMLFLILSVIIWKRGLDLSLKERIQETKVRLKKPVKYALLLLVICFLGMGVNVYYQEHYISKTFFTDEDEDQVYAMNEIKYGKYIDLPQPKIAKANLEMDIYPETRNYRLKGRLQYVNKMHVPIDTILVGTGFKDSFDIEIVNPNVLLKDDGELHYKMFLLDSPLQKGDSLSMNITIRNHPNSFLHDNSRVLSNGTFITNNIIPSLGGRDIFLTSQKKRDKYNLGPRAKVEHLPTDTTLLGFEFSSNTMDKIEYECIVRTSKDQTGLTMGDLIDSGTEDGRNFFHYKSNGPISNTMSWISGTFEKSEGEVAGIKVNIFHHPDHYYNVENLRNGVEASIDYCTKWFGPLHHESINMVEFALPVGTYATIHGNMMPISESKWLCDIDSEKNEDFNHPFFVAAHEVAHYWWGHRVDAANIQGSKMVSESMAEYLAHMVIEETFGQEKMRKQREVYMKNYFELRSQYGKEKPLLYANLKQDYVNYVKGALVMNTMSKYLGEEVLNEAFSRYEIAKRYTAPPYPTSLDFLDTIRTVVPDSLEYLIEDMFETITINDNRLEEVVVKLKENGKYEIAVDFTVSKYRSDENGKKSFSEDGSNALTSREIKSLSLNDYIKIGFYVDSKLEEMKIVKVVDIKNTNKFQLDFKPTRIILDPEVLLMDGNRDDNEWKR